MEKRELISRIIDLFREHTEIERQREEMREMFIKEFGVEPDRVYRDFAEKIVEIEAGEELFDNLLELYRDLVRDYDHTTRVMRITLRVERVNIEGETNWTLIENQLQKYVGKLLYTITIGDPLNDP